MKYISHCLNPHYIKFTNQNGTPYRASGGLIQKHEDNGNALKTESCYYDKRCRHWWHRRLSRHFTVPPMTTKLASWRFSVFSGYRTYHLWVTIFMRHKGGGPCLKFKYFILKKNKLVDTHREISKSMLRIMYNGNNVPYCLFKTLPCIST